MAAASWSAVGIHSLPDELIANIFSHFQHEAIHQNKIDKIDSILPKFASHTPTVKSLRLTCRKFNRVASPLLLPIVRVGFDSASLLRIREILKNPLLASGVHRIQVELGYRFQAVSANKMLYYRMQQVKTRMLFWNLHMNRVTGERFAREGIPNEELSPQTWLSPRSELILGRVLSAVTACDRFIGGEPSGHTQFYTVTNENYITEAREWLDESYRKYSMKQAQHQMIVAERLIVKEIARLARCANRPISLSFVGHSFDNSSSTLYSERESSLEYMSGPQEWEDINRWDGSLRGPDLVPQADIFVDIPLSIHREGGTIHAVEYGHFLVTGRDALVGRGLWNSLDDATLNEIHATFRNLQSFRLHSFGYQVREGPPRLEEIDPPTGPRPLGGVHVNDYLSAVLASPNLSLVSIRASTTAIRHIFGDLHYYFGPELSRLSTASLKHMKFSNLAISQKEMELLIEGLGPEMERFAFEEIYLNDGIWAPILEQLRAKMRRRCVERRCIFSLSRVCGGEIESLRDEVLALPLDFRDQMQAMDTIDEKIGEVFTFYVKGDDRMYQNPGLGGAAFSSAVHELFRRGDTQIGNSV